jgi:hypothetical protein
MLNGCIPTLSIWQKMDFKLENQTQDKGDIA